MAKLAIRAEGKFAMPNVSLTPEQQRFIDAHVASGRFSSASEVMRHALRLMQEAEERRERFVAMLCDVSERADREGTLSAEDVDADLKAVIATAKQRA
jgi:antitoxin ParD1/3/4